MASLTNVISKGFDSLVSLASATVTIVSSVDKVANEFSTKIDNWTEANAVNRDRAKQLCIVTKRLELEKEANNLATEIKDFNDSSIKKEEREELFKALLT